MKQFEYHGVEAEKAEAMRRYNNRRSFRNILRLAAVALLCYIWFPTVAISFQTVGDWIYRTGSVIISDRFVVFVFANLIAALIFILSGERNNEKSSGSSSNEQDLYDHYASSSSAVIVTTSDEKVVEDDGESNKQTVPVFEEAVMVTTKKEIFRPLMEAAKVVEYDASNKQIVPAFEEAVTTKKEIFRPFMEPAKEVVYDESNKQTVPAFEEAVTTKKVIYQPLMESEKVVEYGESEKQLVPALTADILDEAIQEAVTSTGVYRRTKSEAKKEIFRPVREYRRTESAKEVAMERLSSEEFRLKVESFIMEKKRMLVQENDVVQSRGRGLRSRPGLVSNTGYGSW